MRKVALALLVLCSGLLATVPLQRADAQQFEMETGASAVEIAEAIAADPSTVTGADWVARPSGGTPTARATGFLAGFPRDATTFGILTSGDATLAPQPNTSPSSVACAARATKLRSRAAASSRASRKNANTAA